MSIKSDGKWWWFAIKVVFKKPLEKTHKVLYFYTINSYSSVRIGCLCTASNADVDMFWKANLKHKLQ